jgi:propanediol dehydratase small subunit
MPEEDVMALYDALRPHRATADELESLAVRLEAVPAPLCAALVREAAAVYARRGLLR